MAAHVAEKVEAAVLIGNGISRIGMDLEKLRHLGPLIGCNNLYKDFEPDYLVSVDKVPRFEAKNYMLEHHPRWKLLTRGAFNNVRDINGKLRTGGPWWLIVETTDEEPIKITAYDTIHGITYNNSGFIGAWWALEKLRVNTLYMVGMDFFRPVMDGDVKLKNDVYHDDQKCFFPGLVEAWHIIMGKYPLVEHVRIGDVMKADREWFGSTFPGIRVISDAAYR